MIDRGELAIPIWNIRFLLNESGDNIRFQERSKSLPRHVLPRGIIQASDQIQDLFQGDAHKWDYKASGS